MQDSEGSEQTQAVPAEEPQSAQSNDQAAGMQGACQDTQVQSTDQNAQTQGAVVQQPAAVPQEQSLPKDGEQGAKNSSQ